MISYTIAVKYKNGTEDIFTMPGDGFHSRELVLLEEAIVSYAGGGKFYTLVNKEKDLKLSLNLGEVQSITLNTFKSDRTGIQASETNYELKGEQ